ncbi:excinuclease ABC subunit UvrC [soil metagenome]
MTEEDVSNINVNKGFDSGEPALETSVEKTLSIELKDKLAGLPGTPGVYQFRDANGKVLYVGKAKVLKNRVRQYFQTRPNSSRLNTMISKIRDLDIISTDSEIEALILELNMIKELKPKYNVNLKDDKSYPYIVVTNEPFPQVFPTRKRRSDGSRYFGPYTDVKNMRNALKTIRDIFKIRSCRLNLSNESIEAGKFKVCLDYHIHKCEGPCEGHVSQEDYREMIGQVEKMLNGKTTSLIRDMKSQMSFFSSELLFEKAARLRDRMDAVEVYSSRQKMVDEEMIDKDIFAFEREDNDGVGMILKIRDGKVIGKSHFYLNNVLDKSDAEITENFITSYYLKSEFIPEEVHLQFELEDEETIKKWLTDKRNAKVEIVVPKIGEKYKMVFLVKKNARLLLDELLLNKTKKEFIPPSLAALKRDLKLSTLPRRIECYDISHIQGTDTVASQVTFFDGKPLKNAYRKYKIKSALNEVGEPDDFMSMREVIYRRFSGMAEERLTTKKPLEGVEVPSEEDVEINNKMLPKPDLVIIDGGKGQLSSAVKVLEDLNMTDVSIIGLAKKLEEVFFPGQTDPHNIPKTSSGLKLLQRVRDEAHRFAITYHRTLRSKRTFTSELLNIEGIGKKTAENLLKAIGSVEKIREMIRNNPDELSKIAGKKTFEKLNSYFLSINENDDKGSPSHVENNSM